jgi:hypothetical protein
MEQAGPIGYFLEDWHEYYPEDMLKGYIFLRLLIQNFIGKRKKITIFERTCVEDTAWTHKRTSTSKCTSTATFP